MIKKESAMTMIKKESMIIENVYECGRCKKDVILSNKDNIICTSCGHRVIFKKRPDRYIEYLSR